MKNTQVFTLFYFFLVAFVAEAQIKGITKDEEGFVVPFVEIYNENSVFLGTSDTNGEFTLTTQQSTEGAAYTFYMDGYVIKTVQMPKNKVFWEVRLEPIPYELSEIVIQKERKKLHDFRQLKDVEGMTINAGKKTEVVVLSDATVNKTTNNARQIFSKVVGLTVNEGSEGGLQLNIGGRGLNPNRTANFNTRQNGYDISADVLGYPESYYTPASEGVEEIQVIRGAASLQYGTQFGGMVNFIMKKPDIRPFAFSQRLALGSYGLFSSFTELSGTQNKLGYYGFYNYKRGDGYRPNSKFASHNAFLTTTFKIDDKKSLQLDILKFYYLAQQPGGLTDYMFYEDPRQSNRTRNWFEIDWNIANLKYQHNIDEDTRFSIQAFGLQASRAALGRIRGKRVSEVDVLGTSRDLIIGRFKNWGAEARFLKTYQWRDLPQTFLIGAKYYQSANESQQGAGSSGTDANFDFASEEFPHYERQSFFRYPNLNLAIFAEHIFKLSPKTTITPGFRIEKIKTEGIGSYRVIFSHAGAILSDVEVEDHVKKDRNVYLLGVGFSHKDNGREWYANFSQNYRSVTFSDIHSDVLGLTISPDITDEKGYSSDVGFRGNFQNKVQFDMSAFALMYGDKIGEYWHVADDGGVERYRDNVGNALTYGFETMIDWDLNKTFWNAYDFRLNAYINTSITGSKYLSSDVPNIKGNEVEFVPLVNFKSGVNVGYKNFIAHLQLTFVSSQYTDATNKVVPRTDNTTGIFGAIPAYYVMDLSMSYKINKHFALEGSLQNLTNNPYFTRRATGYPGPGIIPSEPFNGIISISYKY